MELSLRLSLTWKLLCLISLHSQMGHRTWWEKTAERERHQWLTFPKGNLTLALVCKNTCRTTQVSLSSPQSSNLEPRLDCVLRYMHVRKVQSHQRIWNDTWVLLPLAQAQNNHIIRFGSWLLFRLHLKEFVTTPVYFSLLLIPASSVTHSHVKYHVCHSSGM